jgi:hypothetical protein
VIGGLFEGRWGSFGVRRSELGNAGLRVEPRVHGEPPPPSFSEGWVGRQEGDMMR